MMKIEIEAVFQQKKRIVSYSTNGFIVNDEEFNTNIVLNAYNVIRTSQFDAIEALEPSNFHELFSLTPEIILIGTGNTQIYPSHELIAEIEQQGIGISFMDTGAACRAYNILLSESRQVAAALCKISE